MESDNPEYQSLICKVLDNLDNDQIDYSVISDDKN